jgi:hypothetical protein
LRAVLTFAPFASIARMGATREFLSRVGPLREFAPVISH